MRDNRIKGIVGIVVIIIVSLIAGVSIGVGKTGVGHDTHHSTPATRTNHSPTAAAPSSSTAVAAIPRRVLSHDAKVPEGPFRGTITDIHDGDTMTILDYLGFRTYQMVICRIRTPSIGINSAELRTAQGKLDLAYALTLVHVGDSVINFNFGPDKYAPRTDCDVKEPNGNDFGEDMVKGGHAVEIPLS